MEINEQAFLAHIAKLPQGKASYKQLVKELGLRGESREPLDLLLSKLVHKGTLIELRSGHYVLGAKSREYGAGRLTVHRDGYGFVLLEPVREDIKGDVFIPAQSLGDAMHNDRVVVKISGVGQNGRAEGEIVEILERHHQTVVGEFRVKRRGCFVKPYNERIQHWIHIPEGMELPPPDKRQINRVGVAPRMVETVDDLDGLVVNVEIVEHPEDGQEPIGRVIEILGDPEDFGIDVEITIRKFQIPHEFPESVLNEARSFGPLTESERAGREDFRLFPIVTIDGETARDFDDAVWVDKLPNGNYLLHVHIADVSHYVKPGSPIDREAALRGTSVYFPDRAVPMLPVELSTDLCSLRPNEDRPVLSAILEIDPKGDTVRQEFCRGIIRSHARMTYTKMFAFLEGDAELREEYKAFTRPFELMKELALVLNRRRVRRGSIDFDLPEPMIEFDNEGAMIGVVRHPRNIAHRLIEEFMLAANEAVSAHLENLELPSLFRIHTSPNPTRVLELQEQTAEFGYSLDLGDLKVKRFAQNKRMRDGRKVRKEIEVVDPSYEVSSKVYQKLIAKIEGKPEERIVSYLLLRSMKQARYSAENKGHYALAAESYTHFTSPIRRYPDLIIHRLLTAQLLGEAPPYTEDQLAGIADHSSMTERRAAEAERELVEWKKAKFMNDRLGQEFDAMILNANRTGLFIELADLYVEGIIPIQFLPGDKYGYEETSRRIIGQRNGRTFKIGDRIRVMLEKVDVMERRLTFSIYEPTQGTKRRKNKYARH